MNERAVLADLDAIFGALVMGDEESHGLFREILDAYGLISEAMESRFQDESLGDLCRETKTLLEFLADESKEISEQSVTALKQAMASLQMLLMEDADPQDITIPKFAKESDGVADSEDGIVEAPGEMDESSVPADETEEAKGVADEDSVPLTPLDLSAFLADGEMAADFISESVEHIEQVDVQLLTLEQNTKDTEALNAVFRAFHTIKGLSGFFGLDHIQGFAHVAETLLDYARQDRVSLEGQYLDLTFDANECLKKGIGALQESLESGKPVFSDLDMATTGRKLEKALAEIDSGGGASSSAPNDSAEVQVAPISLEEETPLAEAKSPVPEVEETGCEQDSSVSNARDTETDSVPEPASVPPVAPVESAKPEQRPEAPKVKEAAAPVAGMRVKETIRVDAQRLDLLMDSVGELVIAESILASTDDLRAIASPQIDSLLCHMDKITRELQEMAMSLRMMPIRPTFQKMARLARDVAKKLDRQVSFVTKGDDTELDKSVVDALGDPLVHMVRNAIDHGLEKTIEERREAGKSDAGQVELRAFHQGGNIVIEIEDDGRGMDRDAIIAKAIKNGIITDGDGMSDADAFGLIFTPGFSTAEKLTDVSGRGVGLDVVQRGIEALRGTVEVSSTVGKGTVFTLRLPLTLAIIEGMVVRVGEQKYIIPTLSIVRMQKFDHADVSTVLESGHLLRVNDDLIPLYRLADVFDSEDGFYEKACQSVVIVEGGKRQYAFIVDELIGQQQIVIKGLGQAMGATQGLSGGAIMSDGRVGLIVDISGLVRLAEATELTTTFAV